MDLDPSLVSAVKGFEGFAPKAAWDYKQYTNGYGTRASGPHETIDAATAEQRLAAELGKAQSQVDAMGVNMPTGVRNALTSLTYNSGNGWMQGGLGDAVKAGDWDKARSLFLDYNHAGGQVSPGLTARRLQEASWWPGAPSSAAAPQVASGTPQAAPATSSPPGPSATQGPSTASLALPLGLSLLGFQTPPPTAAPSLPLWPLTQSSPAQPPSFWDQLAANRTS